MPKMMKVAKISWSTTFYLKSLISIDAKWRCAVFHRWNSTEEHGLMAIRPCSYSVKTLLFRVDHLGDPPNAPYPSRVSHQWENQSHHTALAFAAWFVGICTLLHRASMLGACKSTTSPLRFTNVSATLFECCTILHSLSVQIADEGMKYGDSFGGYRKDVYICRESICVWTAKQ